MKKIVIYSMLSLVALTLVGCGNSAQSQAMKDLNNQLDRAQTTIEEISKQDLSSLCKNAEGYDATYKSQPLYTNSLNLLNLQNKVSNDVTMQSQLSDTLLGKISEIKGFVKADKKYSSAQIKAVKSLTEQLSTYASKLNSSKNDVKLGMRQIAYNQNINHVSLDGMGSGYNNVSNALEVRKAYFFNIANTLSQLESILNNQKIDYSNFSTQNFDYIEKSDETEQNNKSKNTENQTPKRKNINIPELAAEDEKNSTDDGQNDGNSQNGNKNIDTMPYYRPLPRRRYPYRNLPYGNQYGYGNINNGLGGYGYPYGYGYGYPYNQTGLNPTRNTDTYRPNYVNIDTYRWSKRGTLPNGEYEVQIISTQPFEVIEDDQKVGQNENSAEQSQENQIEQTFAEKFEQTEKEESNHQKLMRQNNKILHNQQ